MKKIFTLLIGIVLSITIVIAQGAPPQAFSYKATIMKANGNAPLSNKTISLRINILTSTGASVYEETFNPTTNKDGQIDIAIGRGGTGFSSIGWSTGEYFLKTEVDANGGINYQLLSETQLLSVPYALHAGTVAAEKQQLSVNGEQLSITDGNTVNLPPDDQQLSVVGEKLSISGGNTVDLPPDDQQLSVIGEKLSISGGNTVDLPAEKQLEMGLSASFDIRPYYEDIRLLDFSYSFSQEITTGGGGSSSGRITGGTILFKIESSEKADLFRMMIEGQHINEGRITISDSKIPGPGGKVKEIMFRDFIVVEYNESFDWLGGGNMTETFTISAGSIRVQDVEFDIRSRV